MFHHLPRSNIPIRTFLGTLQEGPPEDEEEEMALEAHEDWEDMGIPLAQLSLSHL